MSGNPRVCLDSQVVHEAVDTRFELRRVLSSPHASQESEILEREFRLMESLPHYSDFFPMLYGRLVDDDGAMIGYVMEYANGGNVDQFLKAQPVIEAGTAEPSFIPLFCTILSQVLQALIVIHNLPVPIVHCDVRPQNILIFTHADGSLHRAKLADFGESVRLHKPTRSRRILAPGFEPPEIQNSSIYHSSADVYGFGKTAFVLLKRWLNRASPDCEQSTGVLIQEPDLVQSVTAWLEGAGFRDLAAALTSCCDPSPLFRPPATS